MSFAMQVESPDLQRQIDVLKFFPEVVEKHARKLFSKDVAILYSKILPNVPSRRAKKQLRKTVRGKGINLEGRVGWWGSDVFYAINVLEYGAKPHVIKAKPGKYLRMLNGTYVKQVQHPGIRKGGFVATAYESMQGQVESDLQSIGAAIVQEMASK